MLTILISMSTYAQKDELKATDKALKGGDVTAAKAAIDKAEGMMANAEAKYKAKFYFLKAKTYYEIAKKNPSLDENPYGTAAKSFQDLFAYEKESGKVKYTKEAQPLLDALVGEVSQKGIKEYQDKDFTKAKNTLYQTYLLTKKDTVFLEYAASAAYQEKDFDVALKYFKMLKEMGYTGITTIYSAVNNESGEKENFVSKSQMDLMIKAGQYKDAKTEVTKSKKPSIIKNIAWILVEKGEVENAMEAVKEARETDPKDINMLLTQANLLLKLGKKDEFKNLMEEAIKQDPGNASLYFNVGVINQEQENLEEAKKYYNKTLEIDPEYVDGYINLGSAMLEKDKEFVEDMNNNLSNFKKYDAIKAKQLELYKSVVPVYEKARALKIKKDGKEDLDIVRTLMSMYENLEMDAKFKEMKAIWDASK